jgi:hypothetical protein
LTERVEYDELDEPDGPDHIFAWKDVMPVKKPNKTKQIQPLRMGKTRRLKDLLVEIEPRKTRHLKGVAVKAKGLKGGAVKTKGLKDVALKMWGVKGLASRGGTIVIKHYSRALQRFKESGVPQPMVIVVDSYDSPPKIVDEPDVLDSALAAARKRGAEQIDEVLKGDEPDALDSALAAARKRGAEKVAEILKGSEMLTAEAFGKEIGASR